MTRGHHTLALCTLAGFALAVSAWQLARGEHKPSPITAPDAVRPTEPVFAGAQRRRAGERPAPVRALPTYDVQDLGTLGGDWSCAYGLNSAGDIVGVAETAGGSKHAFLYRNGVMRDLGTLGGHSSTAFAINDAGQVAGQIEGLEGRTRPFLWRDGRMREIGDFGGRVNAAHALNNSGQMAGEFLDLAGECYRGFAFFPGRSARPMDTLGGSDSRAFGINNAGDIVGVASTRYDWSHHAFLWQDGTLMDLGTLGGNDSEARAINDLGQIVGSAHTSANEEHAFLWSSGDMTDLGTLGGSLSLACAVNDDGTVVGYSGDAHAAPSAFLWLDGRMWDLNGLVSPSLDWRLTGAYAINNAGQIAGIGMCHGRTRAYLLTPRSSSPRRAVQPPA